MIALTNIQRWTGHLTDGSLSNNKSLRDLIHARNKLGGDVTINLKVSKSSLTLCVDTTVNGDELTAEFAMPNIEVLGCSESVIDTFMIIVEDEIRRRHQK
jgi:hypothetical protein